MSAGKTLSPAKWGTGGKWSWSRWNVFTPVHQKALWTSKRTLYRRVAAWAVARDADTGWRDPVYTNYAVSGVLVARGQPNVHLPAGVFVRQDATLITIDGFDVGDQLWDSDSGRYYAVVDEPEQRFDTQSDGFAYRVVQLKWLPYYLPVHGVGTTVPDQPIVIVFEGPYHLCVLPNDHETLVPLAPYSLCTLGVEYVDVSPASVYSLCTLAVDYEAISPSSAYNLSLDPNEINEDWSADDGLWVWLVTSGTWSIIAGEYCETSNSGASYAPLHHFSRPWVITFTFKFDDLPAVADTGVYMGFKISTGSGIGVEFRYYPKYRVSDPGPPIVYESRVYLATELATHTAYLYEYKAVGVAGNAYSVQIDMTEGTDRTAAEGVVQGFFDADLIDYISGGTTYNHLHTNRGSTATPFDRITLITVGTSGSFDSIVMAYDATLELLHPAGASP